MTNISSEKQLWGIQDYAVRRKLKKKKKNAHKTQTTSMIYIRDKGKDYVSETIIMYYVFKRKL